MSVRVVHEVGELESFLAEILSRGAVVVFLGNELRGDDAAGLLVGYLALSYFQSERLVVCRELENCLGAIQGRELVLVVDAVDASLEPGTIVLATLDALVEALPLSTHGIPLSVLLEAAGVGEAWVVGIQVVSTELGRGVSEPVRASVEAVARALLRAFRVSVPSLVR